MKCFYSFVFRLAVIFFMVLPCAYADIGPVGSPVIPSYEPSSDTSSNPILSKKKKVYDIYDTSSPSLDSPAVNNESDPGSKTMPDIIKNKAGSNAPAGNKNNASDSDNADDSTPPLLVIPFNQHNVYFDHQLNQAVSNTESNTPNASYEIISHVPSDDPAMNGAGKIKMEHLNASYNNNIDKVVSELEQAGVPQSRIHTSTVSDDGVTSQEISVTVK